MRRTEQEANVSPLHLPQTIAQRGHKSKPLRREVHLTASTSSLTQPKSTEPISNEEGTDSDSQSLLPTPSIHITKKGRALPEGLGSLGSQALQIKGSVVDAAGKSIPIRLDSGADITLMSEDYYNSVQGLPKLKEGLRMKLYHLTGHAKVLGYIRTILFT